MRAWLVFVACFAGAVWGGPSLAQQPASPQPDPAKLRPGLAVGYGFGFYKDVSELKPLAKHSDPPILRLDFVSSGSGKVLTSKSFEGVYADIVGFIKLDPPGAWKFRVNSNDGVRVTLGGQMILEDPDVHSDRLSRPAPVEVKESGWYELKVLYFQRKGTSALEFLWIPPGGEQEVVPASAFAHLEE